jgi:leucyl aminopeptidase
MLGSYRFDELKGRPGEQPRLTRVHLVHADGEALAGDVDHGAVVAGGVALTRDLVNRPGGTLNARDLAAVAEDVGRRGGLAVEIWDLERCRAERLGGLLGVNAGSVEEPRLIRLQYAPAGGETGSIALVGKGITFDSGGLSLKPADGMHTMKSDMGGAAAILGAMSALVAVEPSVRVTAFLAATDNMPSGSAMKVGDVIRIRNGTTVEVMNTDAEGRLVLADALALAVEERPDAIVDLATLTGAAMVALGRRYAGVMGNDDQLRDDLLGAADVVGEHLWPLPLPEDYRKDIDSKVADLRNVGTDRYGGALRAGLFLQEFVDELPWAHLDIAGPVFSDEVDGELTGGATGFGVRTLLALLARRSD